MSEKVRYTDKDKRRIGKWEIDETELIEVVDSSKNSKLKRMLAKQKRLTWTGAITIKGVLSKQLFSSIVTDRKTILERGILFSDSITTDKVINKSIADDWNFEGWKTDEIELKGAAGQLVANKVNFKYPTINSKTKGTVKITRYFKNNTIINYWVAKSLIDDESFTIIKEFLKTFDIYYNPKTLAIGIVPRFWSISWWVSSLTLEKLLTSEIEQWYTNEQIGDKNRKFSYTHILRRNLDLELQAWQKTLIGNWTQYNFVAWSRRIGKSYLSAYIAYREFYRKGSWYGDRNRQVLYVTLNDKKAWQPFQYMLQMTEEDRQLWYITVNKNEKEFTCTLTGTKLIFITSWQRGWAASYGADLVVVDEAAMIPNDFWDDLLPIIVQERATVFAISTINETAKQNWFYKYLLNWEMGEWHIQSMRVTIDDNELLRPEDKEAMKEALIGNQMKYWTQLYSIFPSGSTVFKLNWVIQSIDLTWKRDIVVIGYDPAKLGDNASFVVFDPNTFEVIEEHIMKWISYMEQKEFLRELKTHYYNSAVIMDRSWVWEWVYEIFWNLIDASVRYKASWDVKLTPLWYWTVSKGELIDTLRLYLENYNVKISDSLDNLVKELKHFKVLRDRWRVVQYGWVGFTDESVNALALITFYLKHISSITSTIDFRVTKNTIDIDQFGNIIDNENPTRIVMQNYNYEETYNNFIY